MCSSHRLGLGRGMGCGLGRRGLWFALALGKRCCGGMERLAGGMDLGGRGEDSLPNAGEGEGNTEGELHLEISGFRVV